MATWLCQKRSFLFAALISLSAAAEVDCAAPPHGISAAEPGKADASAAPASSVLAHTDAGKLRDQPTNAGTKLSPASTCTITRFPEHACHGQAGPFGEALQKALWFFHANRSGRGVGCSHVQWRGDSHLSDAHIKLDPNDPNGVDMSATFIEAHRRLLDPDGDGEVDLSGGYYDAGDYIKFGMTQGFSAATLAWSLREFPEAFQMTGLEPEALEILRWFSDDFMRSSFIDESGALIAYAHQVGDGTDHTCGWMPPEVRRADLCPRKAYWATAEKPAADVTASAAAALALTALVTEASDPTYARKCATYAAALYAFAAQHSTTKANADGGLYTSEYAADDLAWAALWLYEVSGDLKYLDDTLKPQGWLEGLPGFAVSCLRRDASCWSESWTHCWNSVRSGVFLKLSQLLDSGADGGKYAAYAPAFFRIARDATSDWTTGSVAQTPAGFSFLAGWGSGRYNAAAQFISLVYLKHFSDRDPALTAATVPWAKRQIAYLLGDNPLGKSYVMGFSNKYANQPHHAAGHASISGQPDDPPENRHIVWGALVNGPANAQDGHVDRRSDYGSNEVTIDYNASLVAALAAQYVLQGAGQCGLPDFPPLEPAGSEFYTRSMINGKGQSCRSQVDITLINHSVHPPRYDEQLSVRYYFDISELQAQGKSVQDVSATLINDNGNNYKEPTQLSGPLPCPRNAALYYYELGYKGYRFWGELPALHAPRRAILDVGVPYAADCIWNADNDWSYTGLKPGEAAKSAHVTVYSQGKLIWGEEPACADQPAAPAVPLL